LPHLDALNTKYEARGIKVVVIDVTGRKELTDKVAAEASYKAPVLLDDKGFSRSEYKIMATPTTFVVDQSGRMVFKHVGYSPGMERMYEKEIEMLLAIKTT
jgi:thiol-disulfide isomerase/thioredoxin